MELLGGCFISKSHIDTTEDPEELPPPPPACGLKDGIRPYDLSCVACYATAEDGVGTYEDFVNARVSPYVKGDAPVELGIDSNSPDLGRGGMIDAEVVQACRKGGRRRARAARAHDGSRGRRRARLFCGARSNIARVFACPRAHGRCHAQGLASEHVAARARAQAHIAAEWGRTSVLVFLRDLNVKIDGRTHLGHTCAAGARALLRGSATSRPSFDSNRSPSRARAVRCTSHAPTATKSPRSRSSGTRTSCRENVRRAGRLSYPRRAR